MNVRFRAGSRSFVSLYRWLGRVAVLCACVVVAPFSHAASLIAYTENWPPYNFEESTEVRGIATEILQAACAGASIQCEIMVVPWARAYLMASHNANTLVYTTARKPEREKDFIWIGPILPRTTWIYGKPGLEKTLRSLKDLEKVRIGVVRGEASQQDLENAGVPKPGFRLESSNAEVLRLVNQGIVDVMVDTEIGMAWNLSSAGLPPASMQKLMKLSDDGAYYFAMNLQSNPALVNALQSAVEKLRKEGRIAAIIKRYMANQPRH